MNEYMVLPENDDRDASKETMFGILYDNWQSVRKDLERIVSDFWHRPKAERQQFYDRLGPIFKVGPLELDTFTLRLQEDIDLYEGVADPAQVLNDNWRAGYELWPSEVRRMIRDSLNIELKKEADARAAAEGEEQTEIDTMAEALEPDPAIDY